MEKQQGFGKSMPNINVSSIEFKDYKSDEAALRQSEERHRTVLEEIEEGYIEVDLKGNTAFCNDSFAG